MRDEHQESIGRVIARLREEQGWSQRQLAKWVGLDQSAVSRIEAGRRRVSAQELQRFADTFRVSADALLLGLPSEEAPEPAALPAPATPYPAASPALRAFSDAPDSVDYLESRPQPHPDLGTWEHPDIAGPEDACASPMPAPGRTVRSSLRSDVGGQRFEASTRALRLRAALPAGPSAPAPTAALAHLQGLPAEVAAVVRDWFELRRLAGSHEPALAWSSGHSAEGKAERFAHPLQPAERGSLGGDVLYDRVARFWRSELHVEPDDGPLPDLVPLLEDGLGAQVIVARVAGGEAAVAPAAAERPVCAAVTAGGVPFLFINAARPVVLQRFALAHAFAHLVLGHGDIVDDRIHWSRHNPREAAANDFAEEFLAPVRAVHRWYERRGEPRPELETMLELGNAFGISAWAALYRSRAARRIHAKQFAALNQRLRRHEWELLPRQAYLGGLRDTLTYLTPGECLPEGEYGRPAVLRVPAAMRAWALAAVRGGRLSVERAADCLQIDARELAAQLARLGLE
jgi:transcriptional regulator with XRE-family HTH domain